jgi:hypothetical protein
VVLPVPRSRALRALSHRRPGVALSVLALIATWWVFTRHGPFSSTKLSDLFLYDSYHDLLVYQHLVPYRDFDFEYPPGALIPLWIAGGDADYMSLLMLACAVVAQLAAWALGGPRAGWLMVALPVAAGAMVRTHFDLFPTALTMVGLWLIVAPPRARGMLELGFAVLAVGAMTKLWPGAIAIVALAWLLGRGERPAAIRGGVILLAVVLATGVPFAVLGGFPSSMVRFHLERPVQIESTAASVIEVVGGSYVTGNPIRPDRFKSNGLDGGAADLIGVLSTLAVLVVAVAILWLVARRPSRDALVAAALAMTLAFVCFSKVLSPQYLCWLLPLAAVALGRGLVLGPVLVWVAAFVTQLWFPVRYFDVVHQHAWAVVTVGLRNVVLLTALAATVRALARSPRPVAAAPRSG